MTEEFKIYIDRLKGGQSEKINGAFDPAFLEVDENELQFDQPVAVRGEAYLTDDHLVLHLSASTMAQMPCCMCNKMIKTLIAVGNIYHTEPLSDIPSGIYDFGIALREALLIEVPRTVECNNGKCEARALIEAYMRPETRSESYFPFADIDLDK